jgi:predicted Zn-ribbon and HTH transcriptional regulator
MNKVKCANCGKEVDEDQLDRYSECRACQFEDKSSDMCVGDLNSK